MGDQHEEQTEKAAPVRDGPAPGDPARDAVGSASGPAWLAGPRHRTARSLRAANILGAQRTHGNAFVARVLARQAEGEQAGPAGPLIADSAAFLDALRAPVAEAASSALQGTPWSGLVETGIDGWLESYAGKDPDELEKLIRAEVPTAAGVTSAAALIDAIVGHVRGQIAGRLATSEVPAAGASQSSEPLLKREPDAPAHSASAEEVRDRLGPGRPLEPATRSRLEPLLGGSLDDVRVHDDASGETISREIGARAFTVGHDVAFARGEYRPGTALGDALIAHEMAHVIQQGGADGALPATASATALERDADAAAAGAVAALHLGGRLSRSARPRLRSGLSLRSCNGSGPAPAKTDPAKLAPESAPADPKAVYQQKLAEAVEALKNVGFGRADNSGVLDEEFWELITTEDLRLLEGLYLKRGKHLSDAVDAVIARPGKWSLDCAQFVQFTELYALRHALGADEFNRRMGPGFVLRPHGSGILSNVTYYNRESANSPWKEFPGDKPVSKQTDQLLADAPVGARIMWHNPRAPVGSAFENENTVKLGPDEYAAHGFGKGTKKFTRAQVEEKLGNVGRRPDDPATVADDKKVFLKQIEIFQAARDLAGGAAK